MAGPPSDLTRGGGGVASLLVELNGAGVDDVDGNYQGEVGKPAFEQFGLVHGPSIVDARCVDGANSSKCYEMRQVACATRSAKFWSGSATT